MVRWREDLDDGARHNIEDLALRKGRLHSTTSGIRYRARSMICVLTCGSATNLSVSWNWAKN
jgi:hypothetical protein